MKRKDITVLTGLLLTVCLGCSGGGDEGLGGGMPYVAGIWQGSTKLIGNSCPRNQGLDWPRTLSFTHTVNQIARSVELQTDEGDFFSGNTVGDDGFSVDSLGQLGLNQGDCILEGQIEYDHIDDDEADVNFHVDMSCDDGTDCHVAYEGASHRF